MTTIKELRDESTAQKIGIFLTGPNAFDQTWAPNEKNLTKLAPLAEVETWVKSKGGRYIHALSCDIDSYAPARAFYKKNHYQQVAAIPNYYVIGEGRVDYFKEV